MGTDVKDRVTGSHQHKSRLIPYLLSETWSDKQIQRWRGKESRAERDGERERESNTPEFSYLLCQQVQLTSTMLIWISRRENAYRQKYWLSYANSRLKPLQLVEVQEAYSWLCFFLIFVCLFICIPSLLVKCTCLCERTHLQDFELIVSLSVPYLCAPWKIDSLAC